MAQNRNSLVAFLGLAFFGASLFAKAGALSPQGSASPTPQQLQTVLAPIALYPDALLAQICAAATNPGEVLDVSSWLQQNSYLQGDALANAAKQQGFDPAFLDKTWNKTE